MDMSLPKFDMYQGTEATNCFKSHINSWCPHFFREKILSQKILSKLSQDCVCEQAAVSSETLYFLRFYFQISKVLMKEDFSCLCLLSIYIKPMILFYLDI